MLDFVLDIKANVARAFQTVDFMAVAQKTGFENPFGLLDAYFDEIAQECTNLTLYSSRVRA